MNERDNFVAVLVRECASLNPLHVAQVARKIMRHGATLKRLAEESCNGHPIQGGPSVDIATINRLQDKWDARIERQEARAEKNITAAAAELGLAGKGSSPRSGWGSAHSAARTRSSASARSWVARVARTRASRPGGVTGSA